MGDSVKRSFTGDSSDVEVRDLAARHPSPSSPHPVSSLLSQPLVFSDSRVAAEHIRLPLWRILAFSVGSLPYAMLNAVLAFYFGIFLLEVALVRMCGDCYALKSEEMF